MWILKSDEEWKSDEKRKRIRSFVSATIFIFTLIVFSEKIGYRGYAFTPKSWQEILENLPFYISFSLAFGFVATPFMLIHFTGKGRICINCDKIAEDSKEKMCSCGNQFFDLDKVKWVEDSRLDKDQH